MTARSDDHVALGRVVRLLRARHALTQEQLALESGIDRSFLGGIERGERNITYSTLLRLAKAVGLKGSDLVRLAEEESPELPIRRRACAGRTDSDSAGATSA